MYQRPEFTLADAQKIQIEHLSNWAEVLKPSVYLALLTHTIESNKGVTDPYKVFRGQEISMWVQNYMYNIRNNNI